MERVGSGGMGDVYRAYDVAAERVVAIKKLQSATSVTLDRFVIEARALARVVHPNVVRLFRFEPHALSPYLVMEFVDGEPLSKRAERPLPAREAARLVSAAGRGVHAANEVGVIHRDLKPQNLLVTPAGEVKVVDFGLAKRVDADDTVTEYGQPAGGTPGYMAPEQADATGPRCDRRTDVWGLGATLYCLLTGQPPFPTGRGHFHRVLSDPFTPPRERAPGVPAELDAIVCKCLEKDPARRYQSAAELADDLDRWLCGVPTLARPLLWPQRMLRRVRRVSPATATAWVMTAVALVVVSVAVLLPKPVSPAVREPEVDVLSELQAEFESDRVVTLVPATGLPRWSEWVGGSGWSDITTSRVSEGAAYAQPIGEGTLVLFRLPADRFRVEFELRHERSANVNDRVSTGVGLVLGHQRNEADDGAVVDAWLLLHFNDSDLPKLGGRPGTPQPIMARAVYRYRGANGADLVRGQIELGRDTAHLDSPPVPPGPWRRFVADVSPEGLTVTLRATPDVPNAEPQHVLKRTAEQIDETLKTLQATDRTGPPTPSVDYAHLPTRWKPAGGVGVWAMNSGLAFRNVTVVRIPPAQ